MSRLAITIRSKDDRQRIQKLAEEAPWRTRVEFKAAKRSIPQNSRLWVILSEVSDKLLWHGQKYTAEEWKDFFMHSLRGEKWMPAEDGGMLPIGRSTSQLSKEEFGELMTLMEAFCARQNIRLPWDEPSVISTEALQAAGKVE